MDDTTPKANRRYIELLREAGPAGRLAICASLTRAVRELALAGIKSAEPGRLLSDEELRQRLAVRLYGTGIARRMFAGRPE